VSDIAPCAWLLSLFFALNLIVWGFGDQRNGCLASKERASTHQPLSAPSSGVSGFAGAMPVRSLAKIDRSRCARADNAGFPEAIERPKRNGRPKAERDRSLELDQDLIGYDGLRRGAVPTINGRVMALGDA
jgi:hypothetical protein